MKSTIVSVLIAGIIIVGAVLFSEEFSGNLSGSREFANNVIVSDGKQIITIKAKGRYYPLVSEAKADTPTVLRMQTDGTFDCSSALSIPSIGYRKNLPPTGITEIEIPPQKTGTTLNGLCSMGMYNFKINFN